MAEFIRTETNKKPAGSEVFDFSGADGARLRGATFSIPAPRAAVVLMAGRSEFIEKYFEVVSDLQSRGFSVAMMDWRGQGLSERALPVSEKGHITDFGAFRSDLRLFTEEIAMKRFPVPLVLMTHSMGGAPGLQLLADGYDKFRAAVLCAPMTRLFPSAAKRAAVRAMARAACAIGASRQSVVGVTEYSLKFEGNVLTSDPVRHARFRDLQAAAPNATIGAPTYGWLNAAIDAMEDLHKPDRFAKMKTPTLIISAEHDHLVNSHDHEALAERSDKISRIEIKGALHEILMERDEFRAQYWRAFDDFVEPLLAGAAASVSA